MTDNNNNNNIYVDNASNKKSYLIKGKKPKGIEARNTVSENND